MAKLTMAQLRGTLHGTGRVEWIGLSSVRRGPITAVDDVMCWVGTGLDGDRHAKSGRGKRQVTLIQAEHLPVMSALTGQTVRPEMLRRNIVVSGLNLIALKGARFRIGEALLEGSGPCAPCSRMEENLGPGGYQAMRGHGGITAIVVEAGVIRVGDAVTGVSLKASTEV